MQTLANYLLVADHLSRDELAALRNAVVTTINDWLRQKGAADPSATSGAFSSLTPGGSGRYARSTTAGETASLTQIQLEEPSSGGQTFVTTISFVEAESKLSVYVHLTVKNTINVIAPIITDPKCPWVVRRLFELTDRWSFGDWELPLPIPRAMTGERAGIVVSEMINSQSRTIPIVVVSELEGQTIWGRIAEDLATDLTALAAVVTVDEQASWALTNKLGKLHSCYNGAIRLYWPVRGSTQARSQVWTASTLLSNDHDAKGAVRFRATIRRIVMSVAALTVEPPPELDRILSYAAHKKLADLEARATSHSEELEIAKLFLADNEQLRKELADTKRELAQWSSRAESAEYALNRRFSATDETEISESAANEEESAPVVGEVRYYKKTHSTPNHDVLVRVTDCGHSVWQSSNKAEKAKKGLRKLLGAEDWKALHHCGTCTGGGTWRVRW